MESDNYLIQYTDIKNLSIKDLLTIIQGTEGKHLKNLKLRDLTYHNSTEIWPGEGVYLFREGKKIIYVGKVSSMSFTERIAKHFDLRHWAWMNRLLKILCEKKLNYPVNRENLKLASDYAFKNLNIVLINFTDRSRIDRTERLLRSCTEPLNKFKNLKEKNLEKVLCEY